MTVNQSASPALYVNGSGHGHDAGAGSPHAIDSDGRMPDDNMERIRDLILGDFRRHWDARFQSLQTQLQALEGKVDALRNETLAARQDHFTALATGIDELGQHVRRLVRP